ncbi:hypothetical protein BO82DRAFT_397798 [Aspergillus uvarum CBS 121591]|uniref:Uncharacterized protein n=1 Tax=Aspergillus uvarum CBS 121591 TaxID=1448315 RepID=A0A319DD41_9EURO|nr:hypothetical protein BO82DRAFT_397798 [Aspergillus uvarum CBS 121591]PYH86048.1 hypothetical protein BO82DRAFT_397798 [Aspergillus uvarum CBS 121591]
MKTRSQSIPEEKTGRAEPPEGLEWKNQDTPEISAGDIPHGWTNDPSLLDYYGSPRTSDAHMARCCGLQDARMVLMGTPESGDMQYLITSGGKYYWGHFELDHLEEITKPKTLLAIVNVLKSSKGFKGLRRKTLKPVWVPEPEEDTRPATSGGPSLFTPYDPSTSSQ